MPSLTGRTAVNAKRGRPGGHQRTGWRHPAPISTPGLTHLPDQPCLTASGSPATTSMPPRCRLGGPLAAVPAAPSVPAAAPAPPAAVMPGPEPDRWNIDPVQTWSRPGECSIDPPGRGPGAGGPRTAGAQVTRGARGTATASYSGRATRRSHRCRRQQRSNARAWHHAHHRHHRSVRWAFKGKRRLATGRIRSAALLTALLARCRTGTALLRSRRAAVPAHHRTGAVLPRPRREVRPG